MNGVKSAWDKMKRYNKQDVVLLEKVYLALRPWIQNHPSLSLMDGRPDKCPKCGGGPLVKMQRYANKVTWVQVWKCKNCGGFPRSRATEKSNVMFVN
jgi:hypothetical protein